MQQYRLAVQSVDMAVSDLYVMASTLLFGFVACNILLRFSF